jgi:rhamnulose-1-phosphate aldolase
MDILELSVLKGFIRMCQDGWDQGWHERNGGNLTYRLTAEETEACRPFFETPREWVKLDVPAANLAGEYFLTTGSGRFFRNVALAPIDNIGIVEIDGKGEAWRVVWGLHDAKPTSELPSHLLNHSAKKAADPSYRVIYHAHTPSLIALTFVLPLDDRTFTRALWKSATECPVVFPGGVGVVEWMVPGGFDIALATSKLMAKYDAVVWAHHGLFCAGPDFDITFGLMHTVEKAADIYVRALSCGQGIRQEISDDGIRAIARDFGFTVSEEFLD